MKEDKKDVNIKCFGEIRGCLVAHCNIAKYCNEHLEFKERQEENLKIPNFIRSSVQSQLGNTGETLYKNYE
jgi:hypothetical protein